MKYKDRLIIGLLAISIILFGITHFYIIPNRNAAEESYRTAQSDVSTHDINYILEYKSKYMGDASNIMNLFRRLPLTTDTMTFQLLPDELTIQVKYKDSSLEVGETHNNVLKALIYNSTAAFALIDNLEYIEYEFPDVIYKVSRENIISFYANFEIILNESNWKKQVQKPLSDDAYVAKTAEKLFVVDSLQTSICRPPAFVPTP